MPSRTRPFPPSFDPSQLRPASKFIDEGYAPVRVVVPATAEVRKPLLVRLWHDDAAIPAIKRSSLRRKLRFKETRAWTIDRPFIAREMFLFDEQRLYLDTSIELEYLQQAGLSAVAQRSSEAIAGSADASFDDRFRNDVLLVSHHEGGHTWGHYLVQSVPRMLLFLENFPEGKIVVPAAHAQGEAGFGEALDLYGITRERLAPVEASTVYRARQAVLLDFLFHFEDAAPHPRVLPILRRSIPGPMQSGSKGTGAAYIRRRPDAKRAIGNQAAVDAVMARHGVAIYGPEELRLSEQIELWQRHDLIIATLGSDLTNIVYASPGSRVLVLSPHWFGDAFFFELCVAAGLQWHEIRCGEMVTRDGEEERQSSFAVDVSLLDSVLSGLLG